MNIKLQILQCVLTAILSTSPILPSATTTMPSMHNSEYLPITSYQESLSDIISNYIMTILYKENQIEPITKTKAVVIITEEDIPALSRDEALDSMKLITTKIFDINDDNYLSGHLMAMKKLSQHLHPEEDIKTINAIHFLLENQHRSGIADTIFWLKANKEHEFDKSIPVTEDIAQKPKYEKSSILHKKMSVESKAKK